MEKVRSKLHHGTTIHSITSICFVCISTFKLTLIDPALKEKDLRGAAVSRSTYAVRGNAPYFATGLGKR